MHFKQKELFNNYKFAKHSSRGQFSSKLKKINPLSASVALL